MSYHENIFILIIGTLKIMVCIAHVIIGLNTGGAETALKRLILNSENGIDQCVISLTDLGVIGHELKKAGIKVHTLNMKGLFTAIIAFFKLVSLLNKIRPNIVHCWMYHANLIGGLAAKCAGINNIIWGIRSSRPPTGKPVTYCIMKLGALFSRFIPAKIICVADFAKKKHIDYGYDINKMIVIQNGFNQKIFNFDGKSRRELRNTFSIPDHHLLIGSVGRFHFDKGQNILIDAAKKIIATNKDVVFALVGRDCDSENKKLIAQLQSNDLMNSFILFGEQSDIPSCLSAFDIYCMPSRTEGFPNGLGEAMAVGLPCVATNVGDTEFLLDTTGIIVEQATPVALAKGLQTMLAMPPDKRKSLGSKAAQRISDHFTLENTRKQVYDLYKDLLETSA